LGSWGSEWTGDYQHQLGLVGQLTSCSDQMQYRCLEELFAAAGMTPDYIITNFWWDELNQELSHLGWVMVYENSQYTVWYLRD
jgi:hypothetical protein